MNERTGDVLAVGREAWQMIGRTPGYIVAVRPLRKGAITDFDTTQRMIRLILQKVGIGRFGKTRVIVCVPSVITAVERRAVTEAAKRAGATEVQLLEQPMAAAIGSGLAIHEPRGNMIVDVGGGTSETAMVSLGGIVAGRAIRIGSFDLDSALQLFARRIHGVAIGERTAEEIKVAIGSAYPVDDGYEAEVKGRDLTTGLPRTFVVTPGQVREALAETVRAIVESVLDCLGQAPPELSQDLIVNGIHMVGGGALLAGFDRRLSEETRVQVRVVDAPLEAVAVGAGRCLENFELLQSVFMAPRT
jgi:rod shape-determining protein MreB and related proteins